MKKKHAVSIFTAFTVTLTLTLFANNFDFAKFKTLGSAYDEINCNYYFDSENNYTSIHQIVDNLNNGNTEIYYKTWGTVTRTFTGSNGYKSFYIQSTDKYQNTAGILIYNSPVTVAKGNVITITGTPILYNNLPEFDTPLSSSITIDYTTNKYPVQSFEMPSYFWQKKTDRYSTEFQYAQSMGARLITIKNVNLHYIGSGNYNYASFNSDATEVPLYYASLSNTSNINYFIQTWDYGYSGQSFDVTGILHCLINSSGSVKMQFLLRDINDMVAADEGGGEGSSSSEESSSSGDTSSATSNYSLIIDDSNFSSSNSYTTGNYGSTYASYYGFEYYRTVKNYDGTFITLLPYLETYGDGTEPGAIYNIDPIIGMSEIKITYKTSSSSGNLPSVLYGKNGYSYAFSLPLSTSNKTETIAAIDANYFRVQTNQNSLSIVSIQISYSNIVTGSTSFTYSGSGTGDYRINPIVFSGTLYEGASVSVPWNITKFGDTYTVVSSKTFTY